jgi:Flp pilus assembly protein TadG
MNGAKWLVRDECGAAAAELALVAPLLLIIMCGSIEVGNYFMNEHALLKSVRDGARFAARKSFTNYAGCGSAAATVPSALEGDVKTLVRKGSLDSAANDGLPNWDSSGASFSVTMTCATSVNGQTFGGIYQGNSVGTSNAGPVVIVSATLPYRPLLASFGFTGSGFFLRATQQAAVMGI